jgi:YVTN family beta-propeller protein
MAMVAVLWVFSCKDPVNTPDEPVFASYENGVFIVNEGNFQAGNASVSFLHHDGDTVSHQIVRRDLGLPLGDVAQSLSVFDDKIWVVVNNSGTIRVSALPDGAGYCEVSGLTSPRYLHFISPTKAYCTDLYADGIAIINPAECRVTGSIPTGGWTEEIIEANGLVYVAQKGTDKVLVIDPATDVLLDSLTVGREPNSLVLDEMNRIWVLCSGGLGETNPMLALILPFDSNSVSMEPIATIDDSPSRLCISPDRDRLYWLEGGKVQTLDLNGMPVNTAETLIPGRGGTFYGLDVDPVSGMLYVGDALDYVRRGWLYRFTPQGALQDSFAVGIIPGEFGFY